MYDSKIISDVRKLKEESLRQKSIQPSVPGTTWTFYGRVQSVNVDTDPVTHSVALYQGVSMTLSGLVVPHVVGIRNNAIPVGTVVRVTKIPSTGWVAEVIADQFEVKDKVPPHGHTHPQDGGVVGWLA